MYMETMFVFKNMGSRATASWDNWEYQTHMSFSEPKVKQLGITPYFSDAGHSEGSFSPAVYEREVKSGWVNVFWVKMLNIDIEYLN